MKVRYTREALRDLADILDYIQAQSPQGAKNVKKRIQAIVELLTHHPHSGRSVNHAGLRRVLAVPYPYVVFYRPDATEIVIHGVRHASRRPL